MNRFLLLFAFFVPAVWALASVPVEIYVQRQPTAQEVSANYTGARLEPKYGCYIGAFIDLDSTIERTYTDMTGKVRRLPGEFEELTGKEHASYFFYLGYGRSVPIDWIATLGMHGKIVHIALEPNRGLEYVLDDAYLTQLVQDLAVTGAPIFLRFASEMNGPWTSYHGNPVLYREKFKLVANKIHALAPNVAMVWCPYTTPINPILDYYPGDAAVDWVGVNMYSVTYHNQDWDQPASQIHPVQKLDYIYNTFSHKKPIMIGEFGATHYSALENKHVPQFAQRSISSLYTALPRKYPRVKCINYFDTNNLGLEHRENNNYAVTQNPAVLKTYRAAIAPDYFLSSGAGLMTAGPGGPETSVDAPVPMPARSGQKFGGEEITFSAWYRSHESGSRMRFLLDGEALYIGESPTDWAVTVYTSRVSRGKHTLTAIAERNGRVLGRESVSFTVVK